LEVHWEALQEVKKRRAAVQRTAQRMTLAIRHN